MQEMYQDISQAVLEGDETKTTQLVKDALEGKLPSLEILQKGAVEGINIAGEKWQKNEFFLSDVIMKSWLHHFFLEDKEIPLLRE